jgi:acyl carrier protein
METELSESNVEAICNIIAAEFGIEQTRVTMDAKISEDFGPDSLESVAIAMAVEEHFDITISDAEMERIITVRDLCNVVAQALPQVKE